MQVTFQDIEAAHKLLSSVVKKTEMDFSRSASDMLKAEVFLKFENQQLTGSFKIRGAYNKINSLSVEEKAKGVIACSAGNHAQGVALSSRFAGVKSIIVMPTTAPLNKVNATRSYGAEVILHGDIFDDAKEHALKLSKEKGYTFVHPYEDEKVIAGQGTIGLEIHQTVSDLDTVVVPIGGGGLISGIAIALKHLNPKIKVIGVQSDLSPGMAELYKNKGELSKTPQTPSRQKIATIADGIAIKQPSQVMYDSFIKKYVDEIVTVSDDEIAEAIVFLMERAKTITEGAGAAAMAAVMNRSLQLGKKTCVVLCGGNIDLNIVAKVIERGQIKRGRLMALSVVVSDLPGSLNRLTTAIAQEKANVLEVHHDRVSHGLYMRETRIDFVLETTGPEHLKRVQTALEAAGGRLLPS